MKENIMALNQDNKPEALKRAEAEADAESQAGMVIAAQSAIRKAAHEEYNDPVALGQRLQSTVAVDQRAKDAIAYLTEGGPDRQGTDEEALVLKRAFLNKQDAGKTVEPEPRADGLDVVKEQVAAGEPVDNPNLTSVPGTSTEANAGDKKDEKDNADARKSQPASARAAANKKS